MRVLSQALPAMLFFAAAVPGYTAVSLVRVPQGGLQPQAVTDARGVLHLVYLKGEVRAADVYYVRRVPGASGFSSPLRVNSAPGTAIPAGTIRGAQLAVGNGGRVHVVWNGSETALYYARLNDAGTAFEPQRNLIREATGLDGGGTVAADGAGNVYAAWHAGITGETQRRVWVARSRDEGRTFDTETPAAADPTGACACCGMKALAANGSLYLFYRAAIDGVDRDMFLLGGPRPLRVDRWKLKACPMSSAALYPVGGNVLAAWETEQQVYYAEIDPRAATPPARIAAPGTAPRRKYPAVVRDAAGETILVWTDAGGWGKGGALAWQVYDKAGQPAGPTGRAEGVPAFSMATVVAHGAHDFTIIY